MKPTDRSSLLLTAMADPRLFARWFSTPESWQAWRVFLQALFALPMNEDEAALFRSCTGRQSVPTEPFQEAWLVCGRRAGKSFILALVATYLACFRDYRSVLAPGERGRILVIAT